MKKRFVLIPVVALLFLLVGWVVLTIGQQKSNQQPTKNQEEIEHKVIDEMKHQYDGRIKVSGKVIDEEGNLLDDVKLEYYSNYFDSSKYEMKSSKEVVKHIDGYFSVGCSSCASMRLAFFKDGYYWEELKYSIATEKSKTLKHTNIVVILQKERPLVPFQVADGFLEIRGDALFDVLPIPREGIMHTKTVKIEGNRVLVVPYQRQESAAPLTKSEAANLKPLTTPFIFLAPKNGIGSKVEKTVVSFSPYMTGNPIPTNTRLNASDPADGFVVFVPKRMATDLAYREMHEAPEVGYQPWIDLPVRRPEEAWDFVYFYCRIGGRYGKGRLVLPSFEKPAKAEGAFSHIQVLLNPSGSRNVEGVIY